MLTLRPATQADLATIYALLAQIDAQHVAAEPSFFQQADPPRDEAFMETWLNHPERQTTVAELNGQVVGVVMYVARTTTPMMAIIRPRTFVHVDNLVIDEAYWAQGVGTALLSHVHEWAAGQGVEAVQLGVWAFNVGAQAFYEKMGYRVFYHQLIRVDEG